MIIHCAGHRPYQTTREAPPRSARDDRNGQAELANRLNMINVSWKCSKRRISSTRARRPRRSSAAFLMADGAAQTDESLADFPRGSFPRRNKRWKNTSLAVGQIGEASASATRSCLALQRLVHRLDIGNTHIDWSE